MFQFQIIAAQNSRLLIILLMLLAVLRTLKVSLGYLYQTKRFIFLYFISISNLFYVGHLPLLFNANNLIIRNLLWQKVFAEAEEIAKKYRKKLPAVLATRKIDPLPETIPFDNEAELYANWKWFKFESNSEPN